VIVRFADIGGIVDHHCLNFFFIMQKIVELLMFFYFIESWSYR